MRVTSEESGLREEMRLKAQSIEVRFRKFASGSRDKTCVPQTVTLVRFVKCDSGKMEATCGALMLTVLSSRGRSAGSALVRESEKVTDSACRETAALCTLYMKKLTIMLTR